MPRGKKLSREGLIILVTQHLQRAGTRGLTLQELVDAIGPTRTSLATIRRVLDELRSDAYEAQITYSGKDRRWRLELPLAMPLQAPDPKDHLALVLAKTFVEPHLDAESNARLDKLDEELDARMRSRISPKDLPSRKAVTASTTLGTRIDTDVLLRLHAACRRKVVRILYESPWPDASDGATWQQIEPWALRMFDGAIYLCAWANDLRAPRKFRVAQIDAIEELAEQPDAASRQTPPADVWGDENPGIGIDDDRPGVAVIRFRGGVARWVERTVWHRVQKDVWIEPRQLLERTVAYRSCRELARRLASLLDGIESIQPAELRDEVVALVARAKFLSRRAHRSELRSRVTNRCAHRSELRSRVTNRCAHRSEIRSRVTNRCAHRSELRSRVTNRCAHRSELRARSNSERPPAVAHSLSDRSSPQ